MNNNISSISTVVYKVGFLIYITAELETAWESWIFESPREWKLCIVEKI